MLLFATGANRAGWGQQSRSIRHPLPSSGNPLPHYVDIAESAGLHSRTTIGGETKKPFILESTGGGIAVFDYDNDGWLDIFIVNGSRLDGYPPGEEPTNHLYRNNRDGTFTDVTHGAGLLRHGWGQGVCVGDYDNDGNTDLFVTYYGQNVLYRNNGNGTFTDVTREAGLLSSVDRYCTGAAFIDYDRDGKLDLFLTSYCAYDEAHSHDPAREEGCRWKGVRVFCGPRGLRGGRCFLYANKGNGSFADVSETAGIESAETIYGFTPLVLDYDNDGWPDIYVACDSSRSLLFKNQKNGRFKEVGVMAGVAYNEDGREQAGMGVSAGDYDCDGWLDIVKTNFADDTTTLYRNSRDGTFSDSTFASRLGANTTFLGWGTGFCDFDNDGWADIFIANGHVYPEIDKQPVDSQYAQRKILYRNCRNGTFEDVSLRAGPAIVIPKVSRGVAFGDLFNSGQVDIMINNMNDTPTLLHDTVTRNNRALEIQLIGEESNRSGIGSRVEVQIGEHRMIDEVRSGGSFCSQNDLRLHFGAGSASSVDRLQIKWPSGQVDELAHIPTGHLIVMKEGVGIVRKQPFGSPPKHF
jgi:enediyne biosynthesis protein E4